MRDRLAELQKNMVEEQGNDNAESDVLIQISKEPAPSTMTEFFAEVSSIRENLELIEKEVKNLVLIHRTIIEAPRPSEMSKMQADNAVETARALAMKTSIKIKALSSKMPAQQTSSSARILAVHESTLGMQLRRVMESLYQEQERHKEKSREMLKRQLKIVRTSWESRGESMTEDQLEQMIENGQSVFTGNIMLQTLEAKRELEDIQNRHDDLIALEKSIAEVHALFVEISLLVQNQGETIDNIEVHVMKGQDYVAEGRKQVQEAEKKQTSSRKKKIFCSVIAVVVVIILILVLIFLVP
ncbi:syntaxin-1A-like isoform X1 [Neocloeon triangulifer]|uniref:syntaxin-1A-like isoform X1 n=1 Tax=Neocloeon triangulifer TaxID=2078957 RepID=UPI00286F9810|nr:syntaxin-1A-like isoform X1 [Neocloeon triangulifer]